MKLKNLCLLAILPILFSSCEDDENNNKNNEEVNGVYTTNVVGSINLVDAGVSIPVDMNVNITVRESENNKLTLSIGGESMIVSVDNEGNFTVPAESASQTQTDPETGATLTMNLTSSGFGTIKNNVLYMKETISGNAIIEMNGETNYSSVSGSVVYNGSKSVGRENTRTP